MSSSPLWHRLLGIASLSVMKSILSPKRVYNELQTSVPSLKMHFNCKTSQKLQIYSANEKQGEKLKDKEEELEYCRA